MSVEQKMELMANILDVEVEEITPETRLDELAWDSVAVLSFIVLMDDEFKKEISGAEVKKFVTIQDALNAMEM